MLVPLVTEGAYFACRFDSSTLKSFQEYKLKEAAKKAAQQRSVALPNVHAMAARLASTANMLFAEQTFQL